MQLVSLSSLEFHLLQLINQQNIQDTTQRKFIAKIVEL